MFITSLAIAAAVVSPTPNQPEATAPAPVVIDIGTRFHRSGPIEEVVETGTPDGLYTITVNTEDHYPTWATDQGHYRRDVTQNDERVSINGGQLVTDDLEDRVDHASASKTGQVTVINGRVLIEWAGDSSEDSVIVSSIELTPVAEPDVLVEDPKADDPVVAPTVEPDLVEVPAPAPTPKPTPAVDSPVDVPTPVVDDTTPAPKPTPAPPVKTAPKADRKAPVVTPSVTVERRESAGEYAAKWVTPTIEAYYPDPGYTFEADQVECVPATAPAPERGFWARLFG